MRQNQVSGTLTSSVDQPLPLLPTPSHNAVSQRCLDCFGVDADGNWRIAVRHIRRIFIDVTILLASMCVLRLRRGAVAASESLGHRGSGVSRCDCDLSEATMGAPP